MTIQIYRDVACADGCAIIAELVWRLTANGWSYVAHGTGTAGARSASQPATAADLATALRTAPSSWVCVSRGTRKVSWQRNTTANPDYTAWRYEYTATGTLTPGSATAPDRNTSDSQYVSGNFFRSVAPSTGGVADATKVHILVDDAGASFAALTRRTPMPAGNFGFYSALFMDEVQNPVWAGNPDPVVMGNVGAGTNGSDAAMVTTSYMGAWIGYTLPSPTFSGVALENPGNIAGSVTQDRSGVDLLVEARWATTSPTTLLGTSTLFRLLQPGRTPIVGIDAGGTLNYAAFWTVAVLNDGVALVS
jgi:hypothetical protein